MAAIGGVDPGGGAGVVRDALTAAALGASAHVVGTAWTEQGDAVHRVEPREPGSLAAAVRQAVARGVQAVKIGMVPNGLSVAAILDGLSNYGGPLVIDPVLASSRGRVLFAGTPADILPLLRRGTLVTPNAPEAAVLSGLPVADARGAEVAAVNLREAGVSAVLVKGGHLGSEEEPLIDVLVTEAGVRRFAHPRVRGRVPRGTGCALATAIAVALARKAALEDAIEAAIDWLAAAIESAVEVGGGERHLGPG